MGNVEETLQDKRLKKACVVIPARGGSERLKHKNVYPVKEKPMICYAIEAALECKYVEEEQDIYVSSDCRDILSLVVRFCPEISIIQRPDYLGANNIPKQAVIDHAVRTIKKNLWAEYDIVISLQPNSPEIQSYHLDEVVELYDKYKRWEVFSVDKNLMQNAAFRVVSFDHPFPNTLSTNCGVYVCDIMDVHTLSDVRKVEEKMESMI